MKLENNKKYERKEVITVSNNQKTKWLIFFVYYISLLIIAALINPTVFIFFLGWISYMLLTVFRDWYRDKSLKWYRSDFTLFNELK